MKFLRTTVPVFVSLLLVVTLFSSCEDPVADPPSQVISPQEANDLEEYYKRTRANILNDTLGFEDAREFWFSLDTLKKYIEYVEREAASMEKTDLGIRIYLGAYPENSSYPNAKYSTVFLVPTAKSAGNPLKQGFLPIENENENMEGVSALNYGTGGIPPNDYQ